MKAPSIVPDRRSCLTDLTVDQPPLPVSSSQAVPSRPLMCVCAGRRAVGAGTGCWAWAWGDSVAWEKQRRAGREHAWPHAAQERAGG